MVTRYERSLATILDGLLQVLSPARIFVITTPDHTLTAWGRRWGSPDMGSGDVVRANDILRTVASGTRGRGHRHRRRLRARHR